MKLMLLVIFNIFVLNSISPKNLKSSDIFKGGNSSKIFIPKNKQSLLV